MNRLLPWAFLACLALVQFLCVPGHYIGHEHDDIQYVLAARSLLEGRYSLGIIPGDPPLTVLSPGWPILLMPAALFSGEDSAGYQLWAWAWLVLCNILVWLWLKRRFSTPLAAAGTALFALNPLVLSRAGVLMNEIPYLAFVLGGFLLLDGNRKPGGWTAGLLIAFAWLIRTASLPFAAAVFAVLAYRRRWRALAAASFFWLAAVVAWKVWSEWGQTGMAEYVELMETWGREGLSAFPVVVGGNMKNAFQLLGETLLPWAPRPEGGVLAGIVGAGFWAAALGGLLLRARREGPEIAAVYLGFGIALHALWPWWYERYLPPFLPVLILGWLTLLERLPKPGGIAAALGLTLLSVPVQAAALIGRKHLRYRPELAATYASIRENTAPSAMFASALYCRDAYYAGRPFVPLPLGTGSLAQNLERRGIEFVLWYGIGDLGSSLGPRFQSLRRLEEIQKELSRPDFRVFYRNLEENTIIYERAGSH